MLNLARSLKFAGQPRLAAAGAREAEDEEDQQGEQKDEVEQNAGLHGKWRQRERHFEDARDSRESRLGQDDGNVVYEVETEIEAGGYDQEAGVGVAADRALYQHGQNPCDGGHQEENLDGGRSRYRKPAGPVKDSRDWAECGENQRETSHTLDAGAQNQRKEAQCRADIDGHQRAVEQVVDGDGRPEVDLLADKQNVVRGLGQQHGGEPEIFALPGPDDEQAEDGQADQRGGDAVGVRVDVFHVVRETVMLLFDGEQGRVSGQVAGYVASSAHIGGPDGRVPHADGHMHRAPGGTSGHGERVKVVAEFGGRNLVGGQLARSAHQAAIHVHPV